MIAISATILRRYFRDRSNLFFVFVLPFVIILLVGVSAGSSLETEIGVVGARTPTGQIVLEELGSDDLRFFDGDAAISDATRAVGTGRLAGAIVFPERLADPIEYVRLPGFGSDGAARLDDAVELVNARAGLRAVARDLGREAEAADVAAAGVTMPMVRTERIGDDLWGGLDDSASAALTQTVLFTFLAGLTASVLLVEDRASGISRRHLTAPVPTWRIVAGEIVGRLLITTAQAALIVVATAVFFDVDWGDPFATGAVVVLFAAVAASCSVLLGSMVRRPESATAIGVTAALVLAALGGAMAPIEIFPPTMQVIARFTPHFWAIDALTVTMAGGGIGDVAAELGVLLAVTAALLGTAAVVRRRLLTR